MTISELRLAPLPDDIVCKLLQTTEAYAEMDTLLRIYPDLQDITSKVLFLLDAYYYAESNGDDADITGIMRDYYIRNPNSYIGKFIQTYQACEGYTKEKKAETDILTAVDIVKVNHALLSLDDRALSENNIVFDYLPCIEPFWLILHELYNPKQQYHLALEAAIAFSRFVSFAGEEKLGLPTLTILLSSVLGSDSAFGGLIMQWTLLTDPRGTFSGTEGKSTLLHVLTVFEKIWRFHSAIIYRLVEIKAEMLQNLQISCPALASQIMARLLTGVICLRINDLKSELNISSKTAISHLKLLEQSGILHSLKTGRDRFYFNNIYCDLIQNLV